MREPHVDLAGSAIVVLGEAGLVAAQARSLGEQGFVVLAVGSPTAVAAAAPLIDGVGVRLSAGDPSDPAAWERWAAAAEAEAPLRALVTNHEPSEPTTLLDITWDDWHDRIEAPVVDAYLAMRACAPLLRDNGGGSIVHVTPVAGLDAVQDPATTAASWAVRGMTKTAAQEFGPWGVRVNSVLHGWLEGIAGLLPPLRRLCRPAEVADLVAFLSSDAAGFVSGAEIAVDGAWSAGSYATFARHPPR